MNRTMSATLVTLAVLFAGKVPDITGLYRSGAVQLVFSAKALQVSQVATVTAEGVR